MYSKEEIEKIIDYANNDAVQSADYCQETGLLRIVSESGDIVAYDLGLPEVQLSTTVRRSLPYEDLRIKVYVVCFVIIATAPLVKAAFGLGQ